MTVLERYEGNIAVIEEDGVLKDIPRTCLAENIKEGSVIKKSGDKYVLDEETTSARRKKLAELQDSLFE